MTRRRRSPFGWRTELSRGITWDRYHRRWTARVKVGSRLVVIGRYVELTTAVDERLRVMKEVAGG